MRTVARAFRSIVNFINTPHWSATTFSRISRPAGPSFGESVTYQIKPQRLEHPKLLEIFAGFDYSWPVEVLIHGSYADCTETAFSDLDDFVIYDSQFTSDARFADFVHWLRMVDWRMSVSDPLQHHPHWIVSSDDLDSYDESVMPVSALQHSLSLRGQTCISVKVDRCRSHQGFRTVARSIAADIMREFEFYQAGRISLYRMKVLVSAILLAPALIKQLRGHPTDKRSAILTVRQALPEEAVAAVEAASAIRRRWNRELSTKRYRAFKLLPHIVRSPTLFRFLAKSLSPAYRKDELELTQASVQSLVDHLRREAGLEITR